MRKPIYALFLPLLTGGLAALLTSGGMRQYGDLSKPSFSPPAWLFPVAWTILYLLMGIAFYRVLQKNCSGKSTTVPFLVQLAINFFWPILFFNLEAYLLSFAWLILLLIVAAWTAYVFWQCDRVAGWLFVPYLLWLVFAAFLNYAIYQLN